MSVNIRLPNITANTEAGKLQQVQSYMYQLVEQLNWALNKIDSSSQTAVLQKGKPAVAEDKNSSIATFNDIKGLIIKSADIVNAYYEEINRKLSGLYVAESDFGTFKQETEKITKETSESVEDLYKNVQEIISETIPGFEQRIIDVTANIKSGLLDYNNEGIPVYGMEIGQINEVDGEKTFDKFARFTSDRLSFYDANDTEVAYISDFKLVITDAEVLGNLKLGKYILDTSDGLALRWEE